MATATRSRPTRLRGSGPSPNTVEHFEAWCRLLVLENGKPFVLEPFQLEFLADFFSGVTELLVLLPKKNGKTSLFAALALYHVMFTPDASVPIGAAAREQAMILWGQAAGFVKRSPGLDEFFKVQQGSKRILSLRDSGAIKVYSADADTGDGIIPTLAFIDELHRHKNADLYAVWRDGLGPRNGQIVTISTAGDNEDSALGRMRQAALRLPDLTRDGCHTVGRSKDFVMHEWAVPADADLKDLELVKQANPASWITLKDLKKRRDSPTTESWQWARFACNVWVQGEDAAISPVDWAACGRDGLEIPAGESVVIGLDLGWKRDSTAAVPLRMNGELVEVGWPAIIPAPRDGTSTRAQTIIDAILEMRERWDVTAVVFDRNAGGQQLADWLEETHGISCIDHSQDPAPMALAAMRVAEWVRTGKLRHPNDPALTAHVLAAVAKPTSGEKWRFVKAPRGGKPIDAAVALAMASSMVERSTSGEVEYW